jgi:hypothetical protein
MAPDPEESHHAQDEAGREGPQKPSHSGWKPGDDNTYEVVGGATIPGAPGVHSLGASYPLAVLEVSQDGVRVRLRWRWMAAFFRLAMRLDGGGEGTEVGWTATWSAIDRVLVAPRSIVMFSGGARPCRFVVPAESTARKLEVELVARGVEVTRVRSTVRYALQVGRNS